MKVLVFGSNGYIGKHLVKYLSGIPDIEITGSDIQPNSTRSSLFNYVQCDLLNKGGLQDFDLSKFEVVYFLTGFTGTKASLVDFERCIGINQFGLLNLLSCLTKLAIKPLVVFPSTRLVYKGIKNGSCSESSEKEFRTIYALSKYSGEQYLMMYNNLYQIPFLITRIGVPYGNMFEGEYSYGTVGLFIRQAKSKHEITLYGDGSLKRTFTHVADICSQIYKLTELKTTQNKVFNLSGESFSLLHLAELISSKFQVPVKHLPWPDEDLLLESGDTIFDSSKIEGTIKQTLNYSFTSWVRQNEIYD